MIDSKDSLERTALHYGLLPFFSNNIPGFSVEEMAAPGMLFGIGSDDYGCWEWKGPVIQEQTTAYGKFFRKKAGFVSLELLPDFLNYRRNAYPIEQGSKEEMLLEIIRSHEGLTSTELKRLVFGTPSRRKVSGPDGDGQTRPKRHSLEGALQKLQMGGWLLIADFEYKYTARGDRYGWGVALYSTPDIWFEGVNLSSDRTPDESFCHLADHLARLMPDVPRQSTEKLLR